MNILVAFLALNFIIIAHELGHFTVAKLFGVKVQEFSLFMGPKLFSFKKGETTYSLRLIPVLAYVKLEGEEEASDGERSFSKKPVGVRAAVIAAGPLMNLIVAVILLTVVFTVSGFETNIVSRIQVNSPAYISGLEVGDKIVSYDGKMVSTSMDLLQFVFISMDEPAEIEIIRNGERIERTFVPEVVPAQESYKFGFTVANASGPDSNVLAAVSAGMPAETAGLLPGDRVLQINDTPVLSKPEIDSYMNKFSGGTITLKLERNGETIKKEVTPVLIKNDEYPYIGLELATVEKGSFFRSIGHSFRYMFSVVRSVIYSIGWLISGKVSIREIMGPVGMVSTIGTVVAQSRASFTTLLVNLFNVTAMFSVALGASNLLPFPALDGSKLLILGAEAITRKKLPEEKEAIISTVGIILLLIFAVFVFYNDIAKLIAG